MKFSRPSSPSIERRKSADTLPPTTVYLHVDHSLSPLSSTRLSSTMINTRVYMYALRDCSYVLLYVKKREKERKKANEKKRIAEDREDSLRVNRSEKRREGDRKRSTRGEGP